ncbi:MAG: SPOR domain-containing protein [Firmicutes bacterium]|nr:SPOR domain-containing protein [Bacillota bacterium]
MPGGGQLRGPGRGPVRGPAREPAVPRGPSGATVFITFLVLAALCIGGGFVMGRYILATLGERMADTGGGPGQSTPGGTRPGSGGTSGSGGSAPTGPVPAGGGPGSVTASLTSFSIWSVQVGAFSTRANADKVVADLATKGYPGHVQAPASGSTLYKVRALTVTSKDIAQTAQGRLRTQGYPDCFVLGETVDGTPLVLKGSSLDYLNKAKAAVEALAACVRTEGELWSKFHAGTFDRSDASSKVDGLISSVNSARSGLASLIPPQDLAALGKALDEMLAQAKANLDKFKAYLGSQSDADRIKAESSYLELADAYVRLGMGLRSGS